MNHNNIVDSTEIFRAKRELHEFLQKHPELQSFQDDIDATLKRAGPEWNNRKLYLSQLIQTHMELLSIELNQLLKMIRTIDK